jgi:hypothetical protein
MEHPYYYKLREQLIEFLEVRAHHRPGEKPAEKNNGALAHPKSPQPAVVGT